MDLLETRIETRHFVFPERTNARESAQGGDLLRWMERASGMSAMRCAGGDAVLVGMDGMSMDAAIPVGDVAAIEAFTFDTGTSSIRVYVRAYHENPYTGDQTEAATAKLVLVALDDEDATVEVPDVTATSQRGRRLREEALTE